MGTFSFPWGVPYSAPVGSPRKAWVRDKPPVRLALAGSAPRSGPRRLDLAGLGWLGLAGFWLWFGWIWLAFLRISVGFGFWLSFTRIWLGFDLIWLDFSWIWFGLGWISV